MISNMVDLARPVLDGRYSLIRTLGRGSFGKVKLAEDLTTQELVAIKILLNS